MRILIAACISLAALACATQPVAMEDLERSEHQLTRAIVKSDQSELRRLMADDFTCTVTGAGISFPELKHRHACTGMGQRATGSLLGIEEQKRAPRRRSAVIESLAIEKRGDSATVRSFQSYRGWVPGDFNFVRRAHVTDTWVRREGRWQIVRRVSEPPTTEPAIASTTSAR
jgi:Domain of unknown function (DUF4440)